MVLPLIALEEHFVSSHVPHAAQRYESFPKHIATKLRSLGDERLKDMDNGRVTLQIISHGPTGASPDECCKANDELAQACQRHPDRFAGFAILPMLEPIAAANELERAVKELGFVGALVNNVTKGVFYDEEKYWPTFERAQQLDVPIYLHPSFPSEEMFEHYKGNFSQEAAFSMSIAGWGWHTETGLHILRLYASGLFDRYPKLKIIIGHMGEMLPFAFDRILPLSKGWGPLQRNLKTVWDENIWITTRYAC
jgi:predicted TIM-barrel fold metal-dependent hydrolase